MSETKYPVIVRIDDKESYEWVTLEQANARFIVVDNRLVVNNMEPLSLKYAEFLLECKVDIGNAEHDVCFLKKAIDFLNN